MDQLYLTLLVLTPIAAWGVWWTLWRSSGGKLILATALTGIAFYLLGAYAIHANEDAWGKMLTITEVKQISASSYENKAELTEEVKSRSGRRVHSFTQLTLPIFSAGWYSVVFVAGVCLQTFAGFFLVHFQPKETARSRNQQQRGIKRTMSQ